jgi:flavin reductase (DIM6/NTAB) family NADH-FMN oxidoreductase RutF
LHEPGQNVDLRSSEHGTQGCLQIVDRRGGATADRFCLHARFERRAQFRAISFFTVASSNPPVVVSCTSVPSAGCGIKDTLRNVLDTREFVLNIVSEDFAEKMNECSATVPPEVDEFELLGLTPIPSELVKPDRVAESRVQMECRLVQVATVSEKPNGGSLVLGEVLRFHLAEDVVNNFYVDPDKLRAIDRMAGVTYCRTTDRFELKRPG